MTEGHRPAEADMKVIVDKGRFLRELRSVQGVLDEYQAFLRDVPADTGWEDEALELVHSHQRALRRAQASLRAIDLVAAILREALALSKTDQIRFRLPPLRAKTVPTLDAGADRAERIEELNLQIAELNALVQQAPLALQEKLRVLLNSFSLLFTAILAGDEQRIEEVTDQINLLTSSRESQSLIREIAYIAREVYDSLNAFSAGLPLQNLSESAEGISEAVRRMNSVIRGLEEAALHNLDALDAHLGRISRGQKATDDLLAALRESQHVIGEIKLQSPAASERLTRLQDQLGDGIGSRVMLLRNRAELKRESHISMTANQSFQDLTGQTLKKIIAFVETLEMQIVGILERYRPVLGLSGSKRKEDAPGESVEKPIEKQNQDQVDALLADLGF
jgi:chemotaxis protein CheZ